MLRDLLIIPEQEKIPPGSGIVHFATSYEASLSPYFETTANNVRDEDAIIVSNLKDTVNLLNYHVKVAGVDQDTDIYARCKLHYKVTQLGSTREFDTGWSSIIAMKADQEGFKVSDVIVQTPTLYIERETDGAYRNFLKIEASDLHVFIGYGDHKATTWEVRDTDGKIIYQRKRSKELLTKLVLPIDKWDMKKAYVVRAQFHTSTNADSLWAKAIWAEVSDVGSDVNFWVKTDPIKVNRYLDIGVYLRTSRFESFDFMLKDPNGNIVSSVVGYKGLDPKIMIPGNLSLDGIYRLYGRMKYTDGTYTEWKLIKEFNVRANDAIDINRSISYNERYVFLQPIIQPATKFFMTKEIDNLGIIMPKSGTTGRKSLALYNYEGGRLVYISDMETDDDPKVINKVSTWSTQVIPLYNGNVIVARADSLSATDDTGQGKLTFFKYSPSLVDMSLTSLGICRPNSQFGSTGVSGSAVATADNNIWYVPAIMKNKKEDVNLAIYKLDTETMSETKVADLPFQATRFVSMCLLSNTTILVAGGCSDVSSPDPKNWERSNNEIYIFNTETSSFTHVGTITGIPESWYNLHMVLRKDGQVAIFNNTEGKGVAENQAIHILNLEDGSMKQGAEDFADGRMYLRTIQTEDGDILRISSSPLEPQQVYGYLTTTSKTKAGTGNVDIDSVVTELIVPENTTVTIDNPYKYSKIKILGDVAAGTSGKLVWLDKRVIREFNANTLIVTKAMTLYNNTVDMLTQGKPYTDIFVLDGVDISVRDDDTATPTDPTQD